MRILNVNKFYYLRGGAERYYFALTELLESKGHDVIPFSMQDQRNFPSKYGKYFVSNLELAKPGLKMIRQVSRTIWSLEAKNKLEALLDEVKPDIAHIHLIYHHLSPSILPLLKKRGIPVVMTLHDYKLICPNYLLFTQGQPCERCKGHRYYNAVINRCLKNSAAVSSLAALEMSLHKLMQVYEKNVDVFIAPSQFVKEQYVKFGQDEKKIVVIPHFLDPKFADSVPAKAEKGTEKYALYFGRLSAEKGIDKLLETFYIYQPNLSLKIAGDGPLRPWIESYIQARGLQKKVEWLGHLNTQELMKHIKEAAVVAVPSRVYETFGFSVLESVAMGTPVVAFEVGALPELVTPQVGRVIPLDDRAGFVTAMQEVSGWDHQAVWQSAQELIKTKYNSQAHFDSLMTVYGHLMKGQS